MATVPTYDGAQVRRAPLQGGFQQNLDVSRPARQLAAGLEGLSDVADKAAQRDDNEAAFTAETQLKSDWMQTDADLRKRFRGSNTDGYRAEVDKWWAEAPAKYGANLSPRAKSLASRSLAQTQAQAQAGALRYYEAEKEGATVQAWSAAKASTVQMAITDGSPEALEAARVDIQRKNALEIARTGKTPEELQVQNLRDLTGLHVEFISRQAESDPRAAQAYFDKYKDEIEGSRHDTIGKVLKAESDNQDAQRSAMEWAALPLEEQLAKVAEIDDPELRKKTGAAVKETAGAVADAQRAREKKFSDQAWQAVGNGSKVPEAVLANMDGRERVQLQDFLRQRSEHAADRARAAADRKEAKAIKTDPRALGKLLDLERDDPEAFKKLRMESLVYTLSGPDLEQLAGRQRSLLDPKAGKDMVTYNNKVTARLESLGINTGAGDQEKRGLFKMAAQGEFERHTARTGKPPTPEEEEKILDRLMIEGETSWFGPDRAKTYAESVVSGMPFDPKVPDVDRDKLVEKFRARGVAKPTDEQITAAYKALKGIK